MSTELPAMGRVLIGCGLLLIGVGALLLLAPKIPWIGRLPGDMIIERKHLSFYFPLTSCLIASLLMTLLLWIVGRFGR